MKISELLEFESDEDDRKYPNPIPLKYDRANEIYDFGDDVIGKMVAVYNKEHGITGFSAGNWIKAVSSQKQKYGKTQEVPVNNLISAESHLYEPHLNKLTNGENVESTGKLPIIYKVENEYLVADGNHRVVADIMKGNKTTKALVLDLVELSNMFKNIK